MVVVQQNLLEKAYFIARMSGPAMVRLASSDFWKTPLVFFIRAKCRRSLLFWDFGDIFPLIDIGQK